MTPQTMANLLKEALHIGIDQERARIRALVVEMKYDFVTSNLNGECSNCGNETVDEGVHRCGVYNDTLSEVLQKIDETL